MSPSDAVDLESPPGSNITGKRLQR